MLNRGDAALQTLSGTVPERRDDRCFWFRHTHPAGFWAPRQMLSNGTICSPWGGAVAALNPGASPLHTLHNSYFAPVLLTVLHYHYRIGSGDEGPGEAVDILDDILGGGQDAHDSFDLGVELEHEHEQYEEVKGQRPWSFPFYLVSPTRIFESSKVSLVRVAQCYQTAMNYWQAQLLPGQPQPTALASRRSRPPSLPPLHVDSRPRMRG